MSQRLPAALRDALAQLQAGAEPIAVAADLIRRRAEAAVFHVQLKPNDPRQPLLQSLKRAIGERTFDDGAMTLEDCLRDAETDLNQSGIN